MVMPLSFWITFNLLIMLLLVVDLGVFHRKAHAVGIREALIWSAVWILMALGFAGWINFSTVPGLGHQAALRFLTGYVIEKSLSVDNLFVFLLIFTYFKVDAKQQHRVLFWGILGALVMRGIFIWLGAALLNRFHWIVYVFGAFLLFTGLKMVRGEEKEMKLEESRFIKLLNKILPIWTGSDAEGKYWVRRDHRWYATPLFVVLLVVEATDLLFAVDSIPAILAITPDPFIVYTSNVFAILGLRALYFALAGLMGFFRYLNYGLAAVLIFVGLKMLFSHWYKMPPLLALAVIVFILAVSVVFSMARPAPPAEPKTE